MEKEIEQLGSLFEEPAHPFAAIMGGAKVEEKIEVLEYILPRVDLVIIGGGMAAAFLKDQGYDVGISAGEPDIEGLIGTIMQKSEAFGVRVLLPEDLIVSENLEFGATARVMKAGRIPAGCRIVDIGPQTIMEFIKEIGACRTVVWNGPMGIFEIPQFSSGTTAVATVLATMNAKTIIGGGSTVEAVTQLGLAGRMTHVSTGGGATLRFLSGKTLPGIEVLADRE
jgi:phosphoglycerate kinase